MVVLIFVTGSSSLSHLFANRVSPVPVFFITCSPFFSNVLRIIIHVHKVSFIMMRHKFHREETQVSS